MFDYALEAMQAQVRSKFGQELDKLWQKVIDYRDSELIDEPNYKIRYRKILDFFHQNVAKQFMDLVWKYTGLWIQKTVYTELWECGFCTAIYMNRPGTARSQAGEFQIENMLNGGFTGRYWNAMIPEEFSVEQLVKLATSYDKIKGIIKPDQKEEIRKMVMCQIGFDIRTGFLIEDFLPRNSGIKNFTAQEITALVLHELGHTLTLVEHAADMCALQSSYSYLTSAFKAKHGGSVDEAIKVGEFLTKAAKDKKLPEVSKQMAELTIKLEKNIRDAGSNADIEVKRKLIGGFFEVAFGLISDLFIVPAQMVFGSDTTTRFDPNEQKNKLADLPLNHRILTWQERKADEYAFTHGYGQEIVTSLDTLNRLFSRLGKTPEQIAKINEIDKLGKGIGFFDSLKIALYVPMCYNSYGNLIYPLGIDRFKELLTLSIQQLKANGADPEYIEKYVANIDTMLEKIKKPDQYDAAICRMIKRYQLFIELCSIPSLLSWLLNGRVKRELEVLLDDIQKLSGNLIAYYGIKLQQSAK